MKRKILVRCIIAIATVCMVGCILGCTEKAEPEGYGKISIRGCVELEFDDSAQEAYNTHYAGETILNASILMASTGETFATIKDQSEISNRKKIVLVTDDVDVENAIIVNKWTYYYSVLVAQREEPRIPVTSAFIENLYNDKYCMEKVCYDWLSYKIDVQESPFYGKSWREAMAENGGDISLLPSPVMVAGHIADPICTNPETWDICMQNKTVLRIAALCRYGVLNEKDFSGRGGITLLVLNEWEENGKYCQDNKAYKANVIGYIETEADKLLSTGVSMDKNSEEYKIVMQQLQNPVFYSVCGNFLEE